MRTNPLRTPHNLVKKEKKEKKDHVNKFVHGNIVIMWRPEISLNMVWLKSVFYVYMDSLKTLHDLLKKKKHHMNNFTLGNIVIMWGWAKISLGI